MPQPIHDFVFMRYLDEFCEELMEALVVFQVPILVSDKEHDL